MKITKIEKGKRGNPKGYVEYLPPDFDATKKYHTLIWLPGLGEVGPGTLASLDIVANRSIGQWLKTNDKNSIVLIPQDGSGYWNGATDNINIFADWAIKYYPSIDQGNIHLAGLSSGGYGVRESIIKNFPVHKLYRTLTVMCSNLMDANKYVQTIVDNDQYIWSIQGDKDIDPNKVYAVAPFHDALEKIDAKRSRLTVLSNVGHKSWDYVYNDLAITQPQKSGNYFNVDLFVWTEGSWWTWMDSKKKSVVTPPVDPPVDPEPVKETIVEQYIQEGNLFIKTKDKIYKVTLNVV